MIWYLLVAIFLLWLYLNILSERPENFVSGQEALISTYDQIYPLDHPKYITPQQKDFQIVLSEHSALDPNMQNRRRDIRTQRCQPNSKDVNGNSHCFSTSEWHALNYQWKSSPDIINSKVKLDEPKPDQVIYARHQQEKIVPHNSTSKEMRADLFNEIILPDLFFKHKRVIKKGDPNPQDRNYATAIY